jgi:phage terminase Nu1 subunit (DNA packaging protein)
MDAKPARRKTKVSYVVGTIAEVAEFFALSNAAVNAWRRDANPMPGSPGRFDLSKIAQWRDARRKEGGGVSEELKQADIRLKTAQARAKEMENSVNEGELVPLADVELFVATALIECRVVVMSIPEAIATSAPPELRDHARTEADRTCRAALTSLKRRLELAQLEQQPEADE